MRVVRLSVPAAVGAVTLAVYLLTLYPGQGGGGDAAKFQYLGSVLGTAHPPGYPLYVFVSYLFSHLPLGTLAYRMNLMSACFGALTTSVVFLILVRVKCHPAVAAAAALGLAFDLALWGKSLGAEVYSLNAAIITLVIWQAIRWADSGRRRDLYLTAALLGLSLGNHLTAAMLAPALALFVLLTRPREVRVRTTLICVLLSALGLAQYGFILLRTWQNAPYVEARASTLPALVQVVLASKYADEMFIFSAQQLLTERLPGMARLFADDLGPMGVVFFFVGLVWAAGARSRVAFLFVSCLVSVALLTLNIDADVGGFIVPAIVMAWLIAGLGIHAVWSFASRTGPPARTVVALTLVALPVWQLARNYRVNDHHERTYETRYMNAFFSQIEPRAAIVREVYAVDQLVLYKLAGEHAAAGRTIEMIESDLAAVQQYAKNGYTIYAFDEARKALDGPGLRFAPVRLREPDGPSGLGRVVDMTYMPLYRLTDTAPCDRIGTGEWRDITGMAGAGAVVLRIDNYRAFDADAIFYAGSDSAVAPIVAASQGSAMPPVSLATFRRDVPADAVRLDEALSRDEVPTPASLRVPRYVHRLQFQLNDQGQYATALVGLGDRRAQPVFVRARPDLSDPRRATVCGWLGSMFFARDTHAALSFSPDFDDRLFGSGWDPLEQLEETTYGRWIAGHEATVAVPAQRAGTVVIRIRATPSDDDHAHTIAISINGREFPARAMSPAWADYAWTVPAGTFTSGLNRLSVRIDGRDMPPDERSAFVSALSFELARDGVVRK